MLPLNIKLKKDKNVDNFVKNTTNLITVTLKQMRNIIPNNALTISETIIRNNFKIMQLLNASFEDYLQYFFTNMYSCKKNIASKQCLVISVHCSTLPQKKSFSLIS